MRSQKKARAKSPKAKSKTMATKAKETKKRGRVLALRYVIFGVGCGAWLLSHLLLLSFVNNDAPAAAPAQPTAAPAPPKHPNAEFYVDMATAFRQQAATEGAAVEAYWVHRAKNYTNGMPHEMSAVTEGDDWLLPLAAAASAAAHAGGREGRPSPVIPRVINKMYFQDGGGFTGKLNSRKKNPSLFAAHESWHDLNPGYVVRYFDLDNARRYLAARFVPLFGEAFDCLDAYAGKANLFRMALLYAEGGWHSDWKQVCLVPGLLDEIATSSDPSAAPAPLDFFACRDKGLKILAKKQCVQNSLVGATPRHPVVREQLALILDHVRTQHYGEIPLETTGTCVLSEALRRARGRDAVAALSGDMKPGGLFHWRGRTIVRQKCEKCGTKQNWKNGNNYLRLWAKKKYYCTHAATIFNRTNAAAARGVESTHLRRKEEEETW